MDHRRVSTPTIAVVGAGFSGTLVAAHLLREAHRPLRIVLIERRKRAGTGLAYGTTDKGHLLNVSAGNMSAFPADPGHLLRWLELNREALQDLLPHPVDASSFIPRQVYGLYLQTVLEDAIVNASASVQLEQRQAEVVGLRPAGADPGATDAPGWSVQLEGSAVLQADRVVLAWGNSAIPVEAATALPGLNLSGSHWRQGWSADATADLPPEATVLLLGTGLTMVDTVVSLQARGHRGRILAVSRRGLRPNPHRSYHPIAPYLLPEDAPTTALGLWRLIRERARSAAGEGDDWRAVIDALRPISQQLWSRLSLAERRRFLRHGAVFWDVHRHRIALELDALLDRLQQDRRLEILAGRLEAVGVEGEQLRVRIRRRGHRQGEDLGVDRLISCTGIPLDYSRSKQPLLCNLRDQGLLQPDPTGQGLRTNQEGALRDSHGRTVAGLYTLGSPRRGDLWESVAVPELREQAAQMARTLLSSLPRFLQPLSPLRSSLEAPRATAADSSAPPAGTALLWRQLFDAASSTYTYLVADPASGQAALIDPVLEQIERDLSLLQEMDLQLRFCLETHLHADHITAAGQLRRRTGCRLIVPAGEGIFNADQQLEGGETLELGVVRIEAIASPGHTANHMAYLVNGDHLASGDALLIRGCGRTDFQGGDPGRLYDSLQRLLALPDSTLVFPAHDYRGRTHSSIGEEKRHNPKLAGRSRHSFITLMHNQRLAPPQKLGETLPANAYLGDFQPGDSDADDKERRQRQDESRRAHATEAANREIYNDFIGMFI